MKPSQLGLLGALLCGARASFVKRYQSLARLRRRSKVQSGGKLVIDSSADFLGAGSIILGEGVSVGKNVVFVSDAGARIEIGQGTVIEDGAQIKAGPACRLVIGPRVRIERHATVASCSELIIGEMSQIGHNSIVAPRESIGKGRLSLGRNVWLSQNNIIDLCGDVVIEDEVAFSPSCCIYTHNHAKSKGKLIWDNPVKIAPCTIGYGTWLGHGAIIMPGVTIGRHSIVAASAVVTKSWADHSVVGGIPARLLNVPA